MRRYPVSTVSTADVVVDKIGSRIRGTRAGDRNSSWTMVPLQLPAPISSVHPSTVRSASQVSASQPSTCSRVSSPYPSLHSLSNQAEILRFMSKASKVFFTCSVLLSGGTIWGVHYIQQQERVVSCGLVVVKNTTIERPLETDSKPMCNLDHVPRSSQGRCTVSTETNSKGERGRVCRTSEETGLPRGHARGFKFNFIDQVGKGEDTHTDERGDEGRGVWMYDV